MNTTEEYLVSYEQIINHLKTKGKGKVFFDTLRTRYKLIHKPIIKPPVIFPLWEVGVRNRRGRSVFYVKEIIPLIDEVLRLHSEGFTYKQIAEQLKPRKLQLDELRKFAVAGDHRVKSPEFIDQFEIAKLKLEDHLGWTNDSKEKQFLDHVTEERKNYSKLFYKAIKTLSSVAIKGKKDNIKRHEEECESLGRKLDFCHEIMGSVINLFKALIEYKRIIMTEDDWREAVKKIGKR